MAAWQRAEPMWDRLLPTGTGAKSCTERCRRGTLRRTQQREWLERYTIANVVVPRAFPHRFFT
jgi:hypothetical protein